MPKRLTNRKLLTSTHHLSNNKFRFLALGWGVTSFYLAALHPHPERLTAAIFVDTGNEYPETYEFAKVWQPILEERGLRIITVTPNNTDPLYKSFSRIPIHSSYKGKISQFPAHCRHDWILKKLNVAAKREVRRWGFELFPGRIQLEFGIPVERHKWLFKNTDPVVEYKYPLVDEWISRAKCITRLGDQAPPKSNCYFCPFQSDTQWRAQRRNHPELWAKSVELDESLRTLINPNCYLSESRRPLKEIADV